MTAREQVVKVLAELDMSNLQPHPQGDWQLWLDFFTIPIVRLCPQCDGRLVQRDGRFGAFLGCDNYPDCKYTESSAYLEENNE